MEASPAGFLLEADSLDDRVNHITHKLRLGELVVSLLDVTKRITSS